MRRNCVGSSVVSAMTQTPASRPCGLETIPPMSFSPILTAAASLCCCARAETDTPANNAAAAVSTDSLFYYHHELLPGRADPVPADDLDADFTEAERGVHRTRPAWAQGGTVQHELMWLTGPLILTY